MKQNIEEIDQLIKETLSKEEAAFYDSLDEQNLLEMFVGLFRGKNAWLLIITNIMTVLFFGMFVYSCIQFFNVTTTDEMMKWGFGCVMLLMAMSMLKIYAWMQMDKNVILREMKRLELQVMSLSGKIKA